MSDLNADMESRNADTVSRDADTVSRDADTASRNADTVKRDSNIIALRESVDGLLLGIEALASKEYIESVQEAEERKRRSLGWLMIAISASFVLMFALLATGLYQMNTVVNQLAEYGKQNQRNTDLLVDCTTPSTPEHPHKCSGQSACMSGNLVDQIINGVVNESRKDRGEDPLPVKKPKAC